MGLRGEFSQIYAASVKHGSFSRDFKAARQLTDSYLVIKQATYFFLLVFLLSIPFWAAGYFASEFTKSNPMKLPVSALMTFCPMISAIILLRPDKSKRTNFLKQIFDFKKINKKVWLIPILLLMPTIATLSYVATNSHYNNFYTGNFSFISLLIFFILYFIGAAGEELGWSGYALEPLQTRFGAFKASLILGVVWAVWHIVPYLEMSKTANWIFWQSLSTILFRIVMVWLFNNTNRSVFAVILFHTMINLSPYLLEIDNVNYNPFILAISLLVCSAIILIFWQTNNFTVFRFAKFKE